MKDYAFPHDVKNHDGSFYYQESGMTLRDYFAAAAMQGIQTRFYGHSTESTAQWAYEIADEMLKVRGGG